MARANATGRTKGMLGPFVALPHYLLKCPAWHSLRPVERCAYLEVVSRYNGSNNGRLGMSGRVLARELKISRATGTRALDRLCELGFLEVTTRSSFSCKIKRATEYRVTHCRCDLTGERSSKAFMNWKPQKQNTASPQSHNGFTTKPQNIDAQ